MHWRTGQDFRWYARAPWHAPLVLSVLTDAAVPQVARAFNNPYKVLQVSEDADPSQIKRAYRKLALQ